MLWRAYVQMRGMVCFRQATRGPVTPASIAIKRKSAWPEPGKRMDRSAAMANGARESRFERLPGSSSLRQMARSLERPEPVPGGMPRVHSGFRGESLAATVGGASVRPSPSQALTDSKADEAVSSESPKPCRQVTPGVRRRNQVICRLA